MASFFGEVVTGSFRFFDDEDEDDMEAARMVQFSPTVAIGPEEHLLIFADGELAAAFTRLLGVQLASVSSLADGAGGAAEVFVSGVFARFFQLKCLEVVRGPGLTVVRSPTGLTGRGGGIGLARSLLSTGSSD
jgi:hypothetical protein